MSPSPHPDPLPARGEGDSLEDLLRVGGEKVGEGRIRIDSARALQRLRDFRFADPAHWVLEVLRAATLSYAKHVEVRTDADDVEISFDGKHFPAESMKSLLEQALNAANTPDEKRTRLLSLGVAGALGVNASFVKVTSGGVMLTLSGDEVQVEESKAKGTHLHLRKALGWRVAAALFRGAPEAHAITARAHRYPATLKLNGKHVKLRAPSQVAMKAVEGKGFRLEARLPLGPPLPISRIEIDVGGVLVAQREKLLPGLQLEVWLRADDVRRNASGSDVVDDDKIFEAAMTAVRKVSRELLSEHGEELAADAEWRVAFKEQLTNEKILDEQVKKQLHKLPLFSGPAGEGISLDDLARGVRESSVVHIAKREYPKGSYPEGTVLLEGELYAALLPEAKRVDVAELVKSKQKVALARARHEQMEVEEAVLPSRNWVARGKIDATAVEGEVGFEIGGNGAFVRVLHKGRLMESGELTALAPLRLRAVVNWERPLGDSYFVSDDGGSKLLGLVLKYVEHTATRAICEALPKPEVLPHALELLTRLVVYRNAPLSELPRELKTAPLIPCVEGAPVSLEAIASEKSWLFVDGRRPHGLIEGGRVLVLSPALRDVLRKLGPKKLEDVSARLRDEEEVRRRLAGPKHAAELTHVGARVRIDEEGMHGEVGIPTLPGSKLAVSLLRNGFLLETTELPARYNRAVAIVDCAALKPNASWKGAVRDEAFKRVTDAVHVAQRRLAAELVREKRSHWRFGADQFFAAFLKKELVPFDPGKLDDVTRVVASAPVFESMQGPRSLLQLHEQVKRHGHLYVMPGRREVPPDFEVLVELMGVAEVLGEALGVKIEDPSGAIAALEARQRLHALPLAEFKLSAQLAFPVRHTEARFTVLAGLREGVGDQASGQVHVDGRAYSVILVPCALPLEVVIDAPTFEPTAFRELSGEQRLEVVRLVSSAMQLVVQRALDAKEDDPVARRALLLALGHGIDRTLPPEDAERLLTRALFPCTDGKHRSFHQLADEAPQYVTTAMEGELPNRRPIILASEAPVRLAVGRWPRAVKVDHELSVQVSAMRARAAVAKVDEVVSKVKSPWRQKVQERDLTGELVVTTKHAGRLELFLDKKPLCVLEGVLPAPLAGAIDSPRLTPLPGFKGVVEDGNLKEAIEALTGAAERLAAKLATADRVLELDEALVQLAFWVGSTLSWQWKGKKKGKGKGKKKEAAETRHELMAKQLLRANDTTTLCVQDLIEQQRATGHVEVTRQGGRFLESGRRAWWPKADEEFWARPLGFHYRDVTAELQLADSIRQRPKFDTVDSPLAGQWRERIHGAGLEGEVAIGPMPDGKLVIEVLHQRMLMETWSSDHPVGGVARVDSSALTPNETWTAVKRDASFKALVTATEAALERLLVRRLPASGSRPFAIAAVKWRSGQAGPLSAVVPGLELFRDLEGGPITVGEVFELARKKGKVPIANPYSSNDAAGVVHGSPEALALLSVLGLEVEDVTVELKRAKDLQQALTARRLQSLTWKGDSLVKVKVSTTQLEGELAIRTNFSEEDEVALARDGIAVCALEDTWPGVVGVIDVKDLSVNDDWTGAEPTRGQRNLIRAQVERLYAELAVKAPSYSNEQRELAAHWALHFLVDEGLATASQLPRLTGVSAELADAPLFLTVDGEKVTLRAVADEVSSRERVSVLTRSMGRPGGVVTCVLATSSMSAPWLDALEELFGKTKVWRVTELEEWTRANREADPPEGAAELHGLRFLRREVRLLRAGALGQLTPDDLEDVKLSRSGGGTAMRYDKKRKLALLDPEHPDIARALKEAQHRPERLWVLLAALFGLVNRELHHVTDAHEAQLLLALAGHLASNPKLLPIERE